MPSSTVLWTGCSVEGAAEGFAAAQHGLAVSRPAGLGMHVGRTDHRVLYVEDPREKAGREGSSTTAIIDSQTAKGASQRGASLDPSGYYVGK